MKKLLELLKRLLEMIQKWMTPKPKEPEKLPENPSDEQLQDAASDLHSRAERRRNHKL